MKRPPDRKTRWTRLPQVLKICRACKVADYYAETAKQCRWCGKKVEIPTIKEPSKRRKK